MLHRPFEDDDFEDIEGGAQAGEELQEEAWAVAGAGGAVQRRRVC